MLPQYQVAVQLLRPGETNVDPHCIFMRLFHISRISRRLKHLLPSAQHNTSSPSPKNPGQSPGTCCDTGLPKFVDSIHGLGSRSWFFQVVKSPPIPSTEMIVAALRFDMYPGVVSKGSLIFHGNQRQRFCSIYVLYTYNHINVFIYIYINIHNTQMLHVGHIYLYHPVFRS